MITTRRNFLGLTLGTLVTSGLPFIARPAMLCESGGWRLAIWGHNTPPIWTPRIESIDRKLDCGVPVFRFRSETLLMQEELTYHGASLVSPDQTVIGNVRFSSSVFVMPGDHLTVNYSLRIDADEHYGPFTLERIPELSRLRCEKLGTGPLQVGCG